MNCNEGLGLESRIKTSYGRLLPAEKKIADYILGHESLPALDIDTLARKTETSKASVSRFCRRLGYGGFKEFSLHLARECAEARTDASDHIARIVEANAQASLDTHYLLDEETVEKVARAIAGAGRIFLFGSSAVGPVILDFAQKMLRLGLVCHYDPGRRMQQMQAVVARKGDLVMAFDLSGESRATVRAASDARARGARLITLCCGFGSRLSEVEGIHLFGVGQKVDNYVTGTGETRISLLNIVDVLFYKLMQVLPKEATEDALNRTKEVIIEDWD